MRRPIENPSETIFTLRARDGVVLRAREWRPAEGTSLPGCVLLQHGIQSHAGWYAKSCAALARAGFRVVAVDRRGSGMNETDRGHARSAEQWMDDGRLWLERLRDEGSKRTVVLGVSWGGKLAAALGRCCPERVAAVGMLYPGLFSRFELNWHQRARLALAQRLGLWRKQIPIPLDDPALFTSDPVWREFIRTDPLSLREMTVGFLTASLELDGLSRGTERGLATLTQPLLLAMALRDEIIDNRRTLDWFAAQPSLDKTVREYDASHTLEFEPCHEQFVRDLVHWVTRVGTAAPLPDKPAGA